MLNAEQTTRYMEETFGINIKSIAELVDLFEEEGCKVIRDNEGNFLATGEIKIYVSAAVFLFKNTNSNIKKIIKYVMDDYDRAREIDKIRVSLKITEMAIEDPAFASQIKSLKSI